MSQFASGIVQVQPTAGSICAMVWNPGNQNTTSLGALGSVPSNAVLNGLIIANTGSSTIYLYSGSQSAGTTTGIPLAPASELYLSGYAGTGAAAGTIWACSGNNLSTASSTQAGLPSVVAVI